MKNEGFPPVFDSESRFLLLGSYPSVVSRESGFYYGNIRNRFWTLMKAIFCFPKDLCTTEEKKKFLLSKKIAIWDVVSSCKISGSSDSSIKDPVINDLGVIFRSSKIEKVLLNGRKAFTLYKKYFSSLFSIPFVLLPSTSPANASYSFDRLFNVWKKEMIELN